MSTTNINYNRYDYGTYYQGRETIAASFEDRADAERAINALKDAGYSADQIGVALRDRTAQGELVEDTGTSVAGGTTAGLLGGGLFGGLVGWLVGIGALAIPGIGPVIAGGALATAFGVAGGTAVAGAGIGAAAGGVVGALVGLGLPEEEASYFESGFRTGRTLVTVKAGASRVGEVADILRAYGGDIGPASRFTTQVRDDRATTASNWETASAGYRRDWERQHTGSGETWATAEPAYRYGHELASDTQYRGKNWNDIEAEARGRYVDWARNHGYSADERGWERLREQVREAWDRGRVTAYSDTASGDAGRAI
jgi:hypothetical protein